MPLWATVDSLGQHALSCRKHPGSGRVQRHAQINDLIHRALIRAEIPSSKEPLGLSKDDGKRPDGLTLVPWYSGHSATWDVTVVHTLAASYVAQSAVQAGKAAEIAAERKSAKYSGLSSNHIFILVAVEFLGPLADGAHRFITEIGKRMTFSTGIREKRRPVPTHLCGDSTLQRRVSCRHFYF